MKTKSFFNTAMGALAIVSGVLFYNENQNPFWLLYIAVCALITISNFIDLVKEKK